MSQFPHFPLLTTLAIALIVPLAGQAQEPSLSTVTALRCTFPVSVVTSLRSDTVKPEIKASTLVLEFETINADEGTAQLKSSFGKFDIIVRSIKGYLHFIQSFYEGPLYVTTILDRKTSNGKWKAMHSRHEYTEVSLPTYTSSPEQYYGECEPAN